MNAFPAVCAAISMTLAAGSAFAQPAASPPAGPPAAAPAKAGPQPPMNDFAQAFYRCDGGEAFMMSYDGDTPATAEMVTNSDSRHYQLKRGQSANGVQFAGGGAKFWTDGKSVVAEGAKASFHNCKMKTS